MPIDILKKYGINYVKRKQFSQIHYFNDSGDELNSFTVNQEVVNDMILQKEDGGVLFWFKNFTLSVNNEDYSFLPNGSDTDVVMPQLGFDVIEKIPNKTIYYSLLNVGARDSRGYITLLRFVSGNESYDVIIPYYVQFIAYDEEYDRFIYRFDTHQVSADEYFTCGFIEFSQETGKYYLSNEKKSIKRSDPVYFSSDDVLSEILLLADNGVAYTYGMTNPLSDIVDGNGDLLSPGEMLKSENVVLFRYKYDLINETSEFSIISEPYKRNNSIWGMLVSPNGIPSVHNGYGYFLTLDFKLCLFDTTTDYESYDFSFDFSHILSCRYPERKDYNVSPNYFDSLIDIGDDGSIYVANIYTDGKLRIYKYNFESCVFELFWESNGGMPELQKKDMQINSFLIIS